MACTPGAALSNVGYREREGTGTLTGGVWGARDGTVRGRDLVPSGGPRDGGIENSEKEWGTLLGL